MTKTAAPALVISTAAKRSGAEKSHSSNDRDVTPPLVISTKAQRSGEISLPYGTVSIRAGDLSALSHNRAEVPLLQCRPVPPLEMTIVAGSIRSFQREKNDKNRRPRPRHFDRSEAEREISRPAGTVGMEQETLPPLPAPASAGDDPWEDRFSEKSHKKRL